MPLLSRPAPLRARLSAAALLVVGVGVVMTFWSEVAPVSSVRAASDLRGNCDEAEHAADPECAGATTDRPSDDPTTTTTGGPAGQGGVGQVAGTSASPAPATGEQRTISAAPAGSITVSVGARQLRLLATAPAPGWRVEVEQAIGREVEVTFRSGSMRVDVNVELEDGEVRERVRHRDDATGVRTEVINGVTSDDDRDDDDSSGPGSGSDDDRDDDDSSGPGSGSDDDRDDDDSSGPRSGSDDDRDDDDDSSGPGSGSDDD